MAIENISRIYEKSADITYIFDVPSISDIDATNTYIVRNKKQNYSMNKITDIKFFLEKIKKLNAKEVKVNSRDYQRFLTMVRNYLELYQYNKLMEEEIEGNLSDEDVKSIASQYKNELKKVK